MSIPRVDHVGADAYNQVMVRGCFRWSLFCLPFVVAACTVEVEPIESDREYRSIGGACPGGILDGGGESGGYECECPILLEGIPTADRYDWCDHGSADCYDLKCGKKVDGATSDCAPGYTGEYCGCYVYWWPPPDIGGRGTYSFYPASMWPEEDCDIMSFLYDGTSYYEYEDGDTPQEGFEVHHCCG